MRNIRYHTPTVLAEMAAIGEVKKSLITALANHIKAIAPDYPKRYLLTQAVGVTPGVFSCIEQERTSDISIDLLIRVMIRCGLPCIITLDDKGVASVS